MKETLSSLYYPMKRQSRKEYALPGDQAGDGAAGTYLEFLNLMANARLVLTNSGDIQEESPGLPKTLDVLRELGVL